MSRMGHLCIQGYNLKAGHLGGGALWQLTRTRFPESCPSHYIPDYCKPYYLSGNRVVKCLPHKHEDPSSIPTTPTKGRCGVRVSNSSNRKVDP